MKFWDELSPKNRRYVVIGAAIAAFSLVMAVMPAGDEKNRAKKEEPTVRAIFTDEEDSNARFERLVAQIENMRSENRDLLREFERVRRDVERQETQGDNAELQEQIRELEQKIETLKSSQPRQSANGSTVIVGGSDRQPGEQGSDQSVDSEGTETVVLDEPQSRLSGSGQEAINEKDLWENQPAPAPVIPEDEGRSSSRDRGEPAPTNAGMRVIEAAPSQASQNVDGEPAADSEENDPGVYMPAGSIITGTLVTGMDAPTGQGARQEPFPALLRIKHEAILPNRFRADVRECFVIVGGFGDLSSERAYLRGESISCVREDGKVVESNLESYTVGEDGKAGLRGRLVSKQGQMLAKGMMAGVMEGFASAFNRSPVPTLSLEAGTKPLYQQAFSEDAVQSGAVTGVGKALDRLAQFYIEQADGMFPVIEIDAGREVEIVLIRGGNLAIK